MLSNISPTQLDGPRLPSARGKASHLVVLCHGYGADGNDLIELAPHWQRFLPDLAFVAPNAPEPCAGSPMGYQWFPITQLDPQLMRQGVEGAAAGLDYFLDSELARHDLTGDKLILVGFSQGTMMALHCGLRRPLKPAAIIGFSGVLAGDAPPNTDVPVLLIHGSHDPMIPLDGLFFSAATLGKAGIAVQWHISMGVGHGIAEDGLSLAADFLNLAVLGRLGGAGSCPVP